MKFRVYNNGRMVNKFDLRGAYLFGSDGIALRRGKVSFSNGFIQCQKAHHETAALALLCPVEGFGSVLLPSTFLPERKEPYILNVELARARLMQVINKREEWSYFDGLGELAQMYEEARELFIRSIQNISSPSKASKLADESLRQGIVFSEKLAIRQSESVFKLRKASRGFGRGCLGCRVSPERLTDDGYLEVIGGLFGSATIPVNWREIERRKGQYDFSRMDVCVRKLSGKRISLGAGPVLRFSSSHLPEWLIREASDFERIREHAYQFTSEIVRRYNSSIRTWSVISGLNLFNYFGFSFEQIVEMTRAANMAAKAGSPKAKKIIDIANPWGEYYMNMENALPPLVYVDMVIHGQIPFDAFGLQMRFGKDEPGMHIRDMMQISAVLDFFSAAGRPVCITDVEIPSGQGDGPYRSQAAGLWHKQWDAGHQAEWLRQFYHVALSKPFVERVCYSYLADTEKSIIANSGLLTAELQSKKSINVIKELSSSIFGR